MLARSHGNLPTLFMSEFEWLHVSFVYDFNVFLGLKESLHTSAFEEYLHEAGSHLGNCHRDSSRRMGKGELLQEKGQTHWISKSNSPGKGE